MTHTALLLLTTIATALAALALLALGIRAQVRRAGADHTTATHGGRPSLGRFAAVLRPRDERGFEALKSRLVQAGLYSRDAVDLYLTVRLCLMIGGALLAALLLPLVGGAIAALSSFGAILALVLAGPSLWLRLRSTKRRAEASRVLPGTLDLVVVCLDAGLNLEQALARVARKSERGDTLLRAELRIVLEEARAGLSLPVAFRRMATRLGHEELHNIGALVSQASDLGGNMGDALRAHAHTMRHHRMIFLEEQAGKANARLTLPLAICLLPAVLLLLMGPALVMIWRSSF